MIRPFFRLVQFRKFLLGSFAFFCFFQTSYAEKKLENSIGFILKNKLPNSSLIGLKSLSISRWHIEQLDCSFAKLGTYKAKDLIFEIKLLPLLFGKFYFKNLIAQSLEIVPNPDTPFGLNIFNQIYLSKKLNIDQVYLSEINCSVIPKPITVQFQKKPLLNFCKIYDLDAKNSFFFEIPRKSRFLRFQSSIHLNFADLFQAELHGDGFISTKSHIELDGACQIKGCLQKIPLEASFDFDKTLSLKGYFLSDLLKGFFQFQPDSCQADLSLPLLSDLLPQTDLKGSLKLDISGPLKDLKCEASSQNFYWKRKALGPLKITGSMPYQKKLKMQGRLLMESSDEIRISSKYFLENNTLNLAIKSKPITTFLKASWRLNQLEKLAFQAQGSNLKFFEGFLENVPLDGEANIVCDYSRSKNFLELFGAFHGVQCGKYKISHASFAFKDAPQHGECKIHCDHFQSPFYDSIDFALSGKKSSVWDLESQIKTDHLAIQASHEISYEKDLIDWKICDLKGLYLNQNLRLEDSIHFTKTKNNISLDPVCLQLGHSKIQGHFQHDKEKTIAYIKCDPLVVKGFKIPYFDVPLTCELQGLLNYDSQQIQGSHFDIQIKNVVLKQMSPNLPPIHFFTTGSFSTKQIYYQGKLFFSNDDYIIGNGSFAYAPFFAMQSDFHNMSMKLHLNDLGQFINLGSNSLGGIIQTDLSIKQNHGQHFTTGFCQISQLHGGFPMLGIYLEEGSLLIRPEGNHALFELAVKDLNKGSAQAKGTLNLKEASYKADVVFDDLFLNFKNLFQTTICGKTSCIGSFKEILAHGTLNLTKSQYLLLHEDIKKNKTYKIEKLAQDLPTKPKEPFCFNLNFDLDTTEPLKVKGLGLESDWLGQSHCVIKNNFFSLKGLLNCKQGLYRFQTKKFIIDEGTIHLSNENPSTILAKGHLDIPTHQIKVSLYGPLKMPKIFFSSLPALSEQSIFSYILFNKPITQLHPYQSVELAQTLLELSGQKNPFSLSKIRANLSVDSLEIRPDEEDENSLKLHIGKYLIPGLLVGLTQSKTSSDMMLQWEMKHGFLIKAESQKQKEGKFSLKWNKTF